MFTSMRAKGSYLRGYFYSFLDLNPSQKDACLYFVLKFIEENYLF